MQNPELDDVDINIIKALIDEPRASLRRIAKKINVSHQTVMNRFEKLKKLGIIKGFTTIIDISKLRMGEIVILGFKCKPGKADLVALGISEIFRPYIALVYRTIGEYDIIVYVFSKEPDKIRELIEKGIERKYGNYLISTSINVVIKGFP